MYTHTHFLHLCRRRLPRDLNFFGADVTENRKKNEIFTGREEIPCTTPAPCYSCCPTVLCRFEFSSLCVCVCGVCGEQMGDLEALDPTLERSFRGHKGAVTSVAWNSNLKQLVRLPGTATATPPLCLTACDVCCGMTGLRW